MNTRQADAFKHFLYDPKLLGISEQFWKVRGPLSGSNSSEIGYPACDDDSIVMDQTTLLSRSGFAGGTYTFDLTVPSAPSAGDSRKWGLIGLDLNGGYEVAFEVSGDTFQAKIIDEDGNTTTESISWDASWTGSSTRFTIEWRRNYVDFRIDGQQFVHFAQRGGNTPPEFYPIQIIVANDNNDTVNLNELQIDEAQMFQAGDVPAEKGETLVDTSSVSDGTYYYYLDMHSYPYATIQFDWTPDGASVTGTIEATTQDDGTKKENCSYQDITDSFFGTTSVSDSTIFEFDTPVSFKYIRLKLVISSSGASTAYQVYTKRQRE